MPQKVSSCFYQGDLTALDKQSSNLKFLRLQINIKPNSFNEGIEALEGFPNHNINTLDLHIVEAPIWQADTENFYIKLFQLLPGLITLRIKFDNDISRCAILKLNSLPFDLNDLDISKLKIKSNNAAYIRSDNRLIYVNKTSQKCIEIPMTEEQLTQFDKAIQSTKRVKKLSEDELKTITSITGPAHINSVDNCLNDYLKKLLEIKVTIKRDYALCLMPSEGGVPLEEGKLYVGVKEGVGFVYTAITLQRTLAENIPLVGLQVPPLPLTIEALTPLKEEILRIASENGDIEQHMEIKNKIVEIDIDHQAHVLPWVNYLLDAGVLDEVAELKLLGFNSLEKTSLIEYDLCLMPNEIIPGTMQGGKLYVGVKEGKLTYTVSTLEGTVVKNVPTTLAIPSLPLTIEALAPLKEEILRIASENGHIPIIMSGLRHCIRRNQIKNLSLFDGIENGNHWENNHDFLNLFAQNSSLTQLNLRFPRNMLPDSFAIVLQNKSIQQLNLSWVQTTPNIDDYLSKNFSVTSGQICFVDREESTALYRMENSNPGSVIKWHKKNKNYLRIFIACLNSITNFINQQKNIYSEGDFSQKSSKLYSDLIEQLQGKLNAYKNTIHTLVEAGFSTAEHNIEQLLTLLANASKVYGVVCHLFNEQFIEALEIYLSFPIDSSCREAVDPKIAHQLFMLESEYIKSNISLVEFYRNLILLVSPALTDRKVEDLIVRILNHYYNALASPGLKRLSWQPPRSFVDLTTGKEGAISYSLLLRAALEAKNLPDDLKASLNIAANSTLYNQSLAGRLLEQAEVRRIVSEKLKFSLQDVVVFESLVLPANSKAPVEGEACAEVDLAKLKDEFIKRVLTALLEERAANLASMSPQDQCQSLLDRMNEFEVAVTKRLDSCTTKVNGVTKSVDEIKKRLGLFAGLPKKRKASCLEEGNEQDREESLQDNRGSFGKPN